MKARANVVLPAPRSPCSAMQSPALTFSASAARAKRATPASSRPSTHTHHSCRVLLLSRRGAMPASGKRTVTRVPGRARCMSDTLPPCNSTRLLTMERPRPAPRCLRALAAALEALEHLAPADRAERRRPDPRPRRRACRVRASADADLVSPALEKPMAFDSRLYSTCLTALVVGDECCRLRDADIERQATFMTRARSLTPSTLRRRSG